MFTHDDDLSKQLIEAGEMAMDKVWRLPLSEEDLEQLDSEFADIANMGDGTAACVVAALFLSQFAGSYRWAHLDVSGTAKIHGEDVGATGRPVALLLQYLLSQSKTTA
jgi:leucyl aminopeptidase